MAKQSSATYQWLDCLNDNMSIMNAVSSTLTPTKSGTYAVVVSLNGCTDTSSCYAVSVSSAIVGELGKSPVSIYPNPTTDYFIVSIPSEFIGQSYTLTDALGRCMLKGVVKDLEDKLDVTGLSIGTYNLVFDQSSERYKLIIQ
jgi:hypothetical protein